MVPSDRKRFAMVLFGVGELYGKVPSDAAIEIYWSALQDVELEAFEMAVHRHVNDPEEGRFMPTVAHIRRHLPSLGGEPLLAWTTVERAMSHAGSYRSVQFEDQIINAVIMDMGGWPWICRQDLDEPWTQKEFERRYSAYSKNGCGLNERLIGTIEENNSSRWREFTPETVLIKSGAYQPLKLGRDGGPKTFELEHITPEDRPDPRKWKSEEPDDEQQS